ncbi:MAG: ArdC family protein [Ignavibacteria bacterium]|nr:ArdC family protein [Ignavibacteria bacterium]
MLPRVKTILDKLAQEFKDGNFVPEAIAYCVFPVCNIPSNKWSLLNQLVMYFAETKDARGFKQWKEAKRYVKKGSKSFDILVPRFKKVKDEKSDEERTYLAGFMCAPIFRVEDTEGEPLDYEKIKLPELPLLDKAKEWGISVSAVPGNFQYYGYYSPEESKIALATPEEKTFFHELSHVAHEKVLGKLKRGQDALQEIIAELSAQALCQIVGKDGHKHFTNSYRYIESYAEKLNITPHTAVLRVLSDVEKVLNLILKSEN